MFKNNLKLTKIEKLRITAYMKKCAENMKKAGGSKIAIVNAYYHNEANAMSKILKETRPNLIGWWNTEEEILYSEKEINCIKCEKNSNNAEAMASINGEWHCDNCAKKTFALPQPKMLPYGERVV